jgi:hypothetical protein
VDWARNQEPDDEEDVPPFDKLNSIPITRRTPEDRKKDVDDALTWIRNGKDDSDDPTGDFEKIDQLLPKP